MRKALYTDDDWFVLPDKVIAFSYGPRDNTVEVELVSGTKKVIPNITLEDFAKDLNRELNKLEDWKIPTEVQTDFDEFEMI